MPIDLYSAAKSLRAYRAGGTLLEADILNALDDACLRESAKYLASIIGISEQYLSDLRRGRRPVSNKLLDVITGTPGRGKRA